MEQAGEESASRKGASANRRAADAHALTLLPTIQKLMAAGFVSHRGLANELNRRGIPTAAGGRWHRNTVLRMLRRLEALNGGRTSNGLGNKRVADVRAEALGPTIRKLRKAGFVSISAIARELNDRGIPTPRGGEWHLTMVTRLLQRLERLDRTSHSRHRR
jgi:Recombinase